MNFASYICHNSPNLIVQFIIIEYWLKLNEYSYYTI